MLEAYLLDKAVYEVGYELNNRPDWVVIPIRGIKHILQQSEVDLRLQNPRWRSSQTQPDQTPTP